MKRRSGVAATFILAVLAVTLVAAPASHAGLAKIGPIDPVGGFPTWYMDANGVALEICKGQPARCLGAPVIPTNPASVAAGFGEEAFYWLLAPTFPIGPNGEDCNVGTGLALEAAWNTASGEPAPGRQIVFSRLRVRCSNIQVGGIYRFVTPFGTRSMAATAVAGGAGPFILNFTDDDIGLPANGFTPPLASPNLGPFLKSVSPAPPPGFLGSGGANATFTPGPNGAFFQIVSPANTPITTANRGILVGKLATNGGLQDATATFSRTATGSGTVNVKAHSIPKQRILATGVGLPKVLKADPVDLGMYTVAIPFTAAQAFSPVTVRNMTDVSRPSIVIDPVVDVVTINSVTWSTATKLLTVRAATSDLSTAAPRTRLRVHDMGTGALLGTAGLTGVFKMTTAIRPVGVRVVSTMGGRDSMRTTVVP